jgi:hypothetical protein
MSGCEYCPNEATRFDPFSQRPCCDQCFNLLIGGDEDDPPFRCGTCDPAGSSGTETTRGDET